ncbi:hypothetical protein GPJ56_000682 [Histomonas meleagridis]|uniref:uncharacterized protein n=1 Tax=Histomonas meleagridis TaxID=135588 RepID=UPI0035599117|nr:hypothetical protein GPJ56_000682 [Histomonas meleagridis]KAH0804811.1 hypothetical protein GO595_002505 [Histomonas meleagridis]
MDFLGLFENITQFTINQVDNKKCVQMSLKSLPEIIPEKYCVGQKCSDGYVKIENKEMCDIKSKVDKGTKKIYLEINDKLDDAIKLSELENLNSEVYINSSSNANVNIDINQLDDQHINKIQISDCTLSIKFKDIKDKEDIIIKIPNIQLTKVTFNDKIENNIKFENNKVILDPKAFQDLSKAKYNNLRIISENKEDITFKDAQTEIGNLVITNDKLTGTLENQLDSGDALTLTLDASVKQFNGFLLESSKSINKLVITFAGNWDKLTDYKNGLIINNLGDIELKDLTSNVNLVLNGKGNVLIGLKGATEITLKNPLTVTQDTNYEVNGVMKFTQIDFVGKSSFTTSIVEESKKVQKTIVDTINVNSATSIKGTLVVNNQMSLKNKSIFISDSIDLTDKMIEFDYSTGEFPKIYTTELMTKPKQILVKYENESKISNDIIGTTQIIYCAPNDKFTLDTCNKYNQTMTFNSNHKELNASSLYGSCNVIFSNQDKKLITCLGVQFPDNPQPSPAGQKSNAGLIVGIIIAFLAVIIIIGVLAVCMRKN